MNWANNHMLFELLTANEDNSEICKKFYHLQERNPALYAINEEEKRVVFRFLAYLIAQDQVMISCNMLYRNKMSIEEIKNIVLKSLSYTIKAILLVCTDKQKYNKSGTAVDKITDYKEFDYHCDEIILQLLDGQVNNRKEMLHLLLSLQSFVDSISNFFETTVYCLLIYDD